MAALSDLLAQEPPSAFAEAAFGALALTVWSDDTAAASDAVAGHAAAICSFVQRAGAAALTAAEAQYPGALPIVLCAAVRGIDDASQEADELVLAAALPHTLAVASWAGSVQGGLGEQQLECIAAAIKLLSIGTDMALTAARRGHKAILHGLRSVQLPALDAALLAAALQLANLQSEVTIRLIEQERREGTGRRIAGGQRVASQSLQATMAAAHVCFSVAADVF